LQKIGKNFCTNLLFCTQNLHLYIICFNQSDRQNHQSESWNESTTCM